MMYMYYRHVQYLLQQPPHAHTASRHRRTTYPVSCYHIWHLQSSPTAVRNTSGSEY